MNCSILLFCHLDNVRSCFDELSWLVSNNFRFDNSSLSLLFIDYLFLSPNCVTVLVLSYLLFLSFVSLWNYLATVFIIVIGKFCRSHFLLYNISLLVVISLLLYFNSDTAFLYNILFLFSRNTTTNILYLHSAWLRSYLISLGILYAVILNYSYNISLLDNVSCSQSRVSISALLNL